MDTMRDKEFLDWVESLGEQIGPRGPEETAKVAKNIADIVTEFKPVLEK